MSSQRFRAAVGAVATLSLAASAVLLAVSPAVAVTELPPDQVSHTDLWSTKTYQNSFVDSPDGTKILYRVFSNASDQPTGRNDRAYDVEMWMADSDGTDAEKLFDISDTWPEIGHGSDAIVWLDNDHFYFNGIKYDVPTRTIEWTLNNPVTPSSVVSAWTEPTSSTELFVNIRYGSNRGYYTIDPTSSSVPSLTPLLDVSDITPFIGGTGSGYEFTYIFESPGGSHLYFIIVNAGRQYAFTSDADGSNIVLLGNDLDTAGPTTGHTIWYDDDQLLYPNYAEQVTTLCDLTCSPASRQTVAGLANHITLSPDKNWIVADNLTASIYLYRFGYTRPVAEVGGDALGGWTDPHPSFSRDSSAVFFTGRSATAKAVLFKTDLSSITDYPNAAFPDASLTQSVEAEDMTLTNYEVFAFQYASAGYMIRSVGSSTSPGAAEFVYTGASGVRTFDVGYRDENDGESSFKFYVDNVLVDDWLGDITANPGGSDSAPVHIISDVPVYNGSVIRIEGVPGAGEPAWLDFVNVIELTYPPSPSDLAVDLQVNTKSQCVNGTAHVAVYARNGGSSAVDVRLAYNGAKKEQKAVAVGAAVYQLTDSGSQHIDDGTVFIGGVIAGSQFAYHREFAPSYSAITC